MNLLLTIIEENPQDTPEQIRQKFANDERRVIESEYTARQLARALFPILGEEAIGLGNRLIRSISQVSAENPFVGMILGQFSNGQSLPFHDPLVSGVIAQVAQTGVPEGLTLLDLQTLLSLTRIPEPSDEDLEQGFLSHRTNLVNRRRAAAEAAVASLSLEQLSDWETLRNTWVAAGDAASVSNEEDV